MPTPTDSATDPLAAVRTYFDGLNRHDIDTVMSAFTDDAVVMPHESPTVCGAVEVEATYRERFARFGYGRELHVDDVVDSGDLAVARCHTTGTLLLKETGATIELESRELFALRRKDDGWRISCYMFNPPAPMAH
jgi:ketosteroid isomerase-like protein